MTDWLKRLRTTSLALILVIGVLLIGLLLGGLFEHAQSPRLQSAFHAQLLAQQQDTQETVEALFHQQVRLLQRLLTISAERPEVISGLAGASQETGSYPAWMPPVHYWRGLLFPDCFQLIASTGEIRGSIALDPTIRCPSKSLDSLRASRRVHLDQSSSGEPWLLIEAPVAAHLGMLRAGVRIDTDFLLRLFGSVLPEGGIVMVTIDRGQGPMVLAATRPDVSPMAPLTAQTAAYLIGEPDYLDEGDWDITLGFAAGLRRDALAPLQRQVLDLAADQRLAMALGYVALLTLLTGWLGWQLSRLRHIIDRFATRVTGEHLPRIGNHHLLDRIRSDLEALFEGVDQTLNARELAQRIEAERGQAELMEQMAEQTGIGLLELEEPAGPCQPLNATMRRYLDALPPDACEQFMMADDARLILRDRDGSRRAFEVDRLREVTLEGRTILLVRDVTRLYQQQRQLEHLASRDLLTGLPNRHLLNEQIRQLIADSRRHHRVFSLLLFDIDEFKSINDHFGHGIGDQALIEVGKNVSSRLRGQDFLARLGGDEFVVLLPETDIAGAGALARKLLDHQENTPFLIDGTPHTLRLSIGGCEWPRDGEDIDALLSHADIAMYHAKRNRLGFAHYDKRLQEQDARRVQLLHGLQEALNRDGIEIAYQPQWDATRGEIHGWEALARWHHPELGPISPNEFIPLAEKAGLIGQITRKVIQRALADCATWRRAGIPGGVAVNVSSLDLKGEDLHETFDAALADTGLEAALVTIELTESTLMEDPFRAAAVLARLDQAGYWTAIDDFGTGYSSLAYLQNLPAHELKIDRTFIAATQSDPASRRIVESLLALAHSLDLCVIAEGVEDEQTARWLINLGCDHLQGYAIARPMPLDALLAGPEFPSWLTDAATGSRADAKDQSYISIRR